MIRMITLLAVAAAAAEARADGAELGRCDGAGTVTVDELRDGPLPREEAQRLATRLLDGWKASHPDRRWDIVAVAQAQPSGAAKPAQEAATAAEAPKAAAQAQGTAAPDQPSGGAAAAGSHLQSGNTYKNFTERDRQVWAAATKRFIDEGNAIFHDAKRLGGTTGISCDMCHPNASNTHPETYPKYQVQLGRVALLRDMVNWCIMNPVRGKPLPDDDPKMKAMEAYILSERRNVAMDYGKH